MSQSTSEKTAQLAEKQQDVAQTSDPLDASTLQESERGSAKEKNPPSENNGTAEKPPVDQAAKTDGEPWCMVSHADGNPQQFAQVYSGCVKLGAGSWTWHRDFAGYREVGDPADDGGMQGSGRAQKERWKPKVYHVKTRRYD